MFGSATAVLMLPALGTPTAHPTLADMAASGLLAAVILGAVNWLYDVAAIRAGILKVYNQPWADGRGSIADRQRLRAVVLRRLRAGAGGGTEIRRRHAAADAGGAAAAIVVGLALLAATVTLPTLGYVLQSYLRHGHHGCRPVSPQAGE